MPGQSGQAGPRKLVGSAMLDAEWVRGPFGPYAAEGRTCRCERTVLSVVHTVTAGTRLADVLPLLEQDPRIQVVYTLPPWALISGGVTQYLNRLGGVVVPWQQAVQVRFDLAVAACYGLLEQLHAPVLTISHGVGYNKYPQGSAGDGSTAPREAAGLERGELIYRGKVIPAAIAVPTQRDLAYLVQACPEAKSAGFVAGDPCYDRLAASLERREVYRRALGARGRTLVAVSSTWGPGSLAQECPDLLSRMVRDLPADEYQVAAIIHPNVWYWHGDRQLRAWHADSMRRGLLLIPPDEGWRAVLAAADVIVGDHGSVTYYGASMGVPVLLAAFPEEHLMPGSPVAEFGRVAPRLRADEPVLPQIRWAAAWPPEKSAHVRSQISDVPGQSARILRSEMYRLMGLSAPDTDPQALAAAVPEPVSIPEAFGVAG
jgi:hypothetical protein